MGTSSLEVAHCEGSMVLRSQSPHVAKTYLTAADTLWDFDRFPQWLVTAARVGHYATLVTLVLDWQYWRIEALL